MARRLTKKQKGFVKDYLATGNGTKAALNNYDTDNYHVAQAIGSENLSKPMIQNAVNDAFPDELLFKVHKEGLQAKQFRFSPEGELIPIDDFATRHKYIETAYKLKGSFAPEKHELQIEDKEIDNEALAEAAKIYGESLRKRKAS